MKGFSAVPELFPTLLEEKKQISQLRLKHACCAWQVPILRSSFFVLDLNLEMASLKEVMQFLPDFWGMLVLLLVISCFQEVLGLEQCLEDFFFLANSKHMIILSDNLKMPHHAAKGNLFLYYQYNIKLKRGRREWEVLCLLVMNAGWAILSEHETTQRSNMIIITIVELLAQMSPSLWQHLW